MIVDIAKKSLLGKAKERPDLVKQNLRHCGQAINQMNKI
jgi:hypothetical protein